MRIHTDILTADDIYAALAAEQAAGRISPHVFFEVLTSHGSRIRARAFEVKLASDVRDAGRRWGNSGGYGATSYTTHSYTATYDEWGWLIAALYQIDADALWGTGEKYAQYRSREDFDDKTGLSYNPTALIRHLTTYAGPYGGDRDPYPFVNAGSPEQAGRIGYGRTDADHLSPRVVEAALENPGKRKGEWLHYMPRTVEGVKAFAKLETVVAR